MERELIEIGKELGKASLLKNMRKPDRDVLWVGTPEEIESFLFSTAECQGMYFASAGSRPGLAKAAEIKGAELFEFDSPLLDLYEAITAGILRHMDWKLQLTDATTRNYGMRDVVEAAAKIIDGAVFFLDKSFHVSYLAGKKCLDSIMARSLMSGDVVTSDRLKKELDELKDGQIQKLVLSNGDISWSTRIRLESTEEFYLILISPTEQLYSDMPILFGMLTDCFAAINLRRIHGDLPLGDFKALFSAIINGTLSGWDEIEAYAKRLPVPPRRFITMAVVSANPSMRRSSLEGFMSKLKTFFKYCNIAAVGDYIVMMISMDNREFQPRPKFNEPELSSLLNNYDAYIAFSNATQRLDMLRTNFLLTESTLRLGMALREQSNSRIFYYEDYAEYIVIELALERFRAIMGHDDLIFLTNPDAVKVYRYDQHHGSDLMLVLYHYCKNSGNISAAAKDAFMHRNTFASRMAEIKEILGDVDLNDGKVLLRLLFSCKVFRYYNSYYDSKASQSLSERLKYAGSKEQDWLKGSSQDAL